MIEKKYEKFLLIPLFILIFFPMPTDILGYSLALWINNFAVIFYLLYAIFTRKYVIPNNHTMQLMIMWILITIIGTFLGSFQSSDFGLRSFTEIIRVIEFTIIYIYFYNYFVKSKSNSINLNIILRKCTNIIFILEFVFGILELFDFPIKNIFRLFYEMNKSGNIYSSYNRIVGTLQNPNFFGVWLCIILQFIYILDFNRNKRYILIGLNLFLIYFTGSRTSLIIAVILLIINYIILHFVIKEKEMVNKKFCYLLFIVFSIIIIVKYSNYFSSYQFKNLLDDMSTLNGRVDMWKCNFNSFNNYIILGRGIDKTLMFDNGYLQYIYYYGILGFTIILSFLFRNLYKAYKSAIINKNKVSISFLGIQIAFLISMITMQTFDVLQISVYYFMGIAYIDIYS